VVQTKVLVGFHANGELFPIDSITDSIVDDYPLAQFRLHSFPEMMMDSMGAI
jgi:hypothetical protein